MALTDFLCLITENIIAIPETVLIELESKKKLFNELGFAARKFSRIMNTLKTTGKEKDPNGCNILIKENDLYKFFTSIMTSSIE